jgi:hypothetical protein
VKRGAAAKSGKRYVARNTLAILVRAVLPSHTSPAQMETQNSHQSIR